MTEWELVAPDGTQRLRVEGGWIYNVWTCEGEARSPVFVPDGRGDERQIERAYRHLQRENAELRRERNAAAEANGEHWVWSDTDPNGLASLVDDATIAMRAAQLRALLAKGYA